MVQGLQALFNQDNGTGRVINLGGAGTITVDAAYHASDGSPLGTATYSLAPYAFHQANGAIPGSADVDAALKKPGTTLVYVNSICGCAAFHLRHFWSSSAPSGWPNASPRPWPNLTGSMARAC